MYIVGWERAGQLNLRSERGHHGSATAIPAEISCLPNSKHCDFWTVGLESPTMR